MTCRQMTEDRWYTSRTNPGLADIHHRKTGVSAVNSVNGRELHNVSTNPGTLLSSGPDGETKIPQKTAHSPVEAVLRIGGGDVSKPDTIRSGNSLPLIQEKNNVEGAPRCSAPRKNVLFLKTHKTGSSTVQNILYRYGDRTGLTFALPVNDVYMGTPGLFQSKHAVKSATGKYNILANHARYNRPGECSHKLIFVQSWSRVMLMDPGLDIFN